MCKIMCSYVVKSKNVKVFNLLSKTNETKNIKWNETCKCKIRLHRNIITNNARIMRNVDPNVKNCLVMEVVIEDLFGILVIVNVNVINYVLLESI